MQSFLRNLIAALSWRTLRRVHKDRRARARFLSVLLFFLWLGYEAVIITFNIRESGPLLGIFPLVVVAFAVGGVLLYRRSRPAEKSGPLTLDLSERPEIPAVAVVCTSPELLCEFAEFALLHAILAARAASEGFLKHKGLGEDQFVITRQNHLGLLREYGMFDRLGEAERALLIAPDGAWGEDVIDRASLLLEVVKVFRWLLKVGGNLPAVGEDALLDFRLARGVLENPAAIFDSSAVVDMDSIRTARFSAETIFYRCYSEALSRGLYSGTENEHAEHAVFYAQRLNGMESEDLLMGNVIVSRAADDQVRLATAIALRRFRLLSWIQGRLYGEEPASTELAAFD